MVRGNKFKPQAAAPATPSAAQTPQQGGTRGPQANDSAAVLSRKPLSVAKAKFKQKRREHAAEADSREPTGAAAPETDAAPQQASHTQKKRKRKPGEQHNVSTQQHNDQQSPHAPTAAGQGSGKASRKRRNNHAHAAAASDHRQRVEAPNDRPASQAQLASGHSRKSSITVAHTAVKGVALAGANWAALKAQLSAAPQLRWKRRKQQQGRQEADEAAAAPEEAQAKLPQPLNGDGSLTAVVAVDCEMVGVGPEGARSQLARVCIVNNHGVVLMDKFARPKERVTDFRTRYSGIRPADIKRAPPFEEVQAQAAVILKDRIVVGHSITNDLKALLLGHPAKAIRDTARYPPLMTPRRPGGKARARALRALAAEQLGLVIQEGEHSPVDDARASLYLYHKHRKEWERELKEHGSTKRLKTAMGGGRAAASRSLADLAKQDDMVDL